MSNKNQKEKDKDKDKNNNLVGTNTVIFNKTNFNNALKMFSPKVEDSSFKNKTKTVKEDNKNNKNELKRASYINNDIYNKLFSVKEEESPVKNKNKTAKEKEKEKEKVKEKDKEKEKIKEKEKEKENNKNNNKNNLEKTNKVKDDDYNKDEQEIIQNNNIDEDYLENSDQEIEAIKKQRENSYDDEDDDDEKQLSEISNRSRSKKVINNKIIESDVMKAEYPEFTADCKFYGEGKERYHVKVIIDSSFKLVFLPEMKNNFRLFNSNFYQFPLLAIKNYVATRKNKKFVIDIILKDYRSFSFKFIAEDYRKFDAIIKEFGIPNQNIKYFRHAYYYYNNNYLKKEKTENYINGWTLYQEDDEFKYLDLDFDNTFRIIDNSKFDFCSSYPKKIVVPISMTDEDIKKCGTYRTKERFPALTYRYKKNGKCIWRSSQTKSGIKGKDNKDVILLTKIAEGSKKLIVFDARPMLNAWANKLKGAGFENTSQYSDINMELMFCGIPNIHAVRKSCHKVYSTLCFKNEKKEEKNSNKNMDDGNWYDAINIIIKKGFQIAEAIKNENTVLIHCSDGWDRTTQLSCTSQLILDKRYRTLDGFICLIEKDWLSFGHQFRYRCGMYCPSDSTSNVAGENQKSPVFIQWLDAVYQIMCQNMVKFEFNTELLYFLANQMFNGKYGTFLFNNEQERDHFNAREKTLSVWSYVKENENRFLNPIYNPNDNLPFIMNYKRIQLWGKYFFRFEDGDNCFDEKITKIVNDLNKTIKKDEDIINDLVNFINKKLPGVDVSSLNPDTQNLFKKKSKVKK